MCSVSNQTPVQLRLAFEPASPSFTDVESFLQQRLLKMAPPLIKTKHYSHKLFRATDPTITTTNDSNNKDNQKTFFAQVSVSTSHAKKSSKSRPKHAASISSSLDTAFMALNENAENESRCRSSLVSPPRSRHCEPRKSCHYRPPTDTDELLRKVSVQLMRAQKGDVSRKCDKIKTSDIIKNWADSQRSVTVSSIESPKLGLDNDISPTSDDCGQFSGSSTPDQQVSGQSDAIDEDKLRLACEHIIEQQKKAWIAFKKAKKNGRRSLTRPALDDETPPLKESPLSNISSETVNIRCKNEAVSLNASNTSEKGHISSEQFDSGHGSSEEHESFSKTERFPAAGNTNAYVSMSRLHYRYHMRRQKGHCPVSKPQTTCNTTSDYVPSPLETATGTIRTNTGEQRLPSRDNSPEFKQSSYMAGYSRPTALKTESIPEPHSSYSPSRFPSHLSSPVCSGLTTCSSSSSSSIVDILQVTTSCCPESLESTCTVSIPTEEALFNCSSPNENNRNPKRTVRPEEKINVASLSSSSSSLTNSLSHSSKNSSKKENNKSHIKLSSTLARGCMSFGFIANACSKIVQIRKTISGKTSNILPSTKSLATKI